MIWRSLFDDSNRQGIVDRLLRLERDAKPRWGRMTGRDRGVFVHKHFDYHLRQVGA